MRFYGLVLVAGATVLGACGGGEKSGTTDTAANAAKAPAPAPATGAAPAAGAVTAAPATGATHEVKMIGDEKGYRFEPANLTIKQGDAVTFTMVSGGPHNVAFDNISPAVHDQLSANMGSGQTGDLSSAMLMNPNEKTTISFAKIPPGKYDVHCTPHLAMNMKGTVTVQ